MNAYRNIEESLATLDAAEPITGDQRRTAESVLDRIVTTDPGTVSPARRQRRRLLLAAAAAAVVAGVAGVLVVLPGALGGGQAYGSWSSVPSALTPAEIARIGPKCLEDIVDTPFSQARARIALAERRGEYAALLYRSTDPDMVVSCLAHNVPGSRKVDHVSWGAASGTSATAVVPARGYQDGALSDFRGASIVEGLAGADVTGVIIHARDLTVQATVAGGRFVAWWPGPSYDEEVNPPRVFLTYDLILRDGTILRDVRPTY